MVTRLASKLVISRWRLAGIRLDLVVRTPGFQAGDLEIDLEACWYTLWPSGNTPGFQAGDLEIEARWYTLWPSGKNAWLLSW